jgi:hypothetical protein
MAIAKLDRARPPELCGQNVVYITREGATDSIDFHNLPDLNVGDIEERRAAAIAYAEMREIDAAASQRIKNSTPKIDPLTGLEKPTRQDRNHSTLILSWDRSESTDKVREMTREFLEKEFKNARCIFTVHTDKAGQSHAHVFIDNKLENGKKLQISQKQFYSLDERWTQRYDREYGTDYAPRFKALKEETLEWKREYAITKERGEEFTTPKPLRYGDYIKANLKEIMRARELRNAGVKEYEQTNLDRDKRYITVEHSAIEGGEWEMESYSQQIERSEQTLGERSEAGNATFSETQGVLTTIERTEHTLERADGTADRTVQAIDECIERSNRLPTQARTRSVVELDRDDDRGR